jgi:hypothetical protein
MSDHKSFDFLKTFEGNNEELSRHAAMTASKYLLSAIDHIDRKFGEGYAKEHPELIGAFMQAAALIAIDVNLNLAANAIFDMKE